MLKAGILFPRSGIYPLLGSDFIAGIRSSLKALGIQEEVELMLEPIGFGSDKKELYQKAELLFLVENADILIAFIDQRISDTIYPLPGALDKPLVIVNPGANYALNWVAPDNVIFLDLEEVLLCRLTGKKAADQNIEKAALAISYYDGGYHHGHAMVSPFLEKGTIVHTYVSPLKKVDFSITPLAQFLKDNEEISTILGLFSGEESDQFLKELVDLKLGRPIKIFGSPFMLGEQNSKSTDLSADIELSGYLPWHSGLDNKENNQFKEQLKQDTGKPANLFSLLGWESGLLLKEYLNLDIARRNPGALLGFLSEKGFSTPRGEMVLDPVTKHLLGPVFESTQNGAEKSLKPALDTDQSLAEWKILVEKSVLEDSSGWTNTYLCS